MTYVIVFFGAGIGGALRHGVNVGAARLFGTGFPAGTLIVNVLGSIAIGILAGYFGLKTGTSQHLRLFLATGLLGGFTTFSAFSLDALLLFERGTVGLALAYIAMSVLLAVAGAAIGLSAVRAFG